MVCDLLTRSPVEHFPQNFQKLQRCVLCVWSGNPARSLACLAERVSCLLATLPEREVIEAPGDRGHDTALRD